VFDWAAAWNHLNHQLDCPFHPKRLTRPTTLHTLVRELFADAGAYDSWAAGWRRRMEEESVPWEAHAAMMRRASPAFIPRNHVVEAVIKAAIERQDFQPFEELLNVVSRPYQDRPDLERYSTPARPEDCVTATFCGT
jgi:uncharacterized protein YdiU (UPF0061 family)